MLKLEEVSSGYGRLEIVHGISLEVGAEEVVAIIGANGAGKTTALRTVSGLLRPTSGSIEFEGKTVSGRSPHEIVKLGLVQVPEGRSLFGGLTVSENISMGAYSRGASERRESLDWVQGLFPLLEERAGQVSSTLSGGQQQMLAIGRALMARPRLLMLDEPSLGLDPKTTARVFEAIEEIRASGIPVLIVEQDAVKTLRLADRAYVLESGEVKLSGTGEELLENQEVRSAYLGL